MATQSDQLSYIAAKLRGAEEALVKARLRRKELEAQFEEARQIEHHHQQSVEKLRDEERRVMRGEDLSSKLFHNPGSPRY